MIFVGYTGNKNQVLMEGCVTTILVTLFLYFNLNHKAIELNNVGHNFFWNFFYMYIKTCILNHLYAIKSVCFDLRSTNVESSVIKTGRREGSLLPKLMSLSIRCPVGSTQKYSRLSTDQAFSIGSYFMIA